MEQSDRGGFTKSKLTLGLCVLGVIAAVAILLATPPISNNSIYSPASGGQPTSASGLGNLAINSAHGQSATQAPATDGARLGISSPVAGQAAISSSQNSMPGNSAPQVDPTSAPLNNAVVTPQTDPLYPIDPMPCKFPLNQSAASCGGCKPTNGSLCCGYGRDELMCASPL